MPKEDWGSEFLTYGNQEDVKMSIYHERPRLPHALHVALGVKKNLTGGITRVIL